MAYNQGQPGHGHSYSLSATFNGPGGFDDDYYMPPPAPTLQAPEPQRINPEMSNNIQQGLQNMNLAELDGRSSYASPPPPPQHQQPPAQGMGQHDYHQYAGNSTEAPHLSPFPKLTNAPPNVPPSDEELEATLENARTLVLNSNDPEMQLAWAADALVYTGTAFDDRDRSAQLHPPSKTPRSSTPRTEHQLKTDAMNIITFLADQHHPKAEFLRGQWLEWGRFGQREDKKEAFRCYSRAADRGYARAEYRIGMLYESYNDPVKALRHYHRGVEAGDAASCYRLGMMTLRGQHGQAQDYAKAVALIRSSAQGADENAAQGAYVYGMLLARQLPQIAVPDEVLAYDERAARVNIEKAAYLKFAKAQLKMGSAYELGGLGCEFSPALSMHYNALASRQGEAEADMALSKWFLVGSEGLFPKNEELAYTYAERAAQSGLATAEFALGYFNEIGMYVPVDIERAQDWYGKAAKHGNDDASARLDGLSRKQVLNKKDHEQVAISRIKSQYGSQRGQRPERFQNRQAAPSRLGQQSTTFDDVAAGYSNGHAAAAVQTPPRGSSITPYPLDDRPPSVAAPSERAASVAPYPLEDGPPKPTPRLGPAGGFFNVQQQQAPPQVQPLQQRPATTVNILPDIRPGSAFQLSPDLRSDSAASVPQLPSQQPAGFGPRPPFSTNAPQRPATTVPSAGASGLHPSDPRARLGAGQRVASGPAGMQQYAQQGPRPGMSSQQGSAATLPPQGSPGSRLDIGFSAPVDNSRQRTYGPGGTGALGGRQPQSPVIKPQALHATSHSNSMPDLGHPAQPSGRASAPPSRPGSRPPPEGRPVKPIDLGNAPKPPVKDSGASSGSGVAAGAAGAAPKPNAPTSSGAQVQKPPGKGPKTFEEMGVPTTKQESECVVM